MGQTEMAQFQVLEVAKDTLQFAPPEALQSVDTNKRNLIPDGRDLNEFLWPDPHIFLLQPTKTLDCIASYLSFHDGWHTVLMNNFQTFHETDHAIGFSKMGWRICLDFNDAT